MSRRRRRKYGTGTPSPEIFRITEDSQERLLENGERRLMESS